MNLGSAPSCVSFWPSGGLSNSLLARLCAMAGAIFLLPGGGCLRYQIPRRGAKGGQFAWKFDGWHITMYLRIVAARKRLAKARARLARATSEEERKEAEAAIKASKRGLPLLGLLNSGTGEILLALDFDRLPPEFATWDELAEYLGSVLPEHSVLTRTHSGKCKLCVLFRFDGKPAQLKRSHKEQILRAMVPAEVAGWLDAGYVDTSGNAMSVLYLPSLAAIYEMATKLRTRRALACPGLPDLDQHTTAHTYIGRQFSALKSRAERKAAHRFGWNASARDPVLAEALASFAGKNHRLKPVVLDSLMRVLEAQQALRDDTGLALPVKKLGRELAERIDPLEFTSENPDVKRKCLRRWISNATRYLKYLKANNGFLELVNGESLPPENARSRLDTREGEPYARVFRAKGELKAYLIKKYGPEAAPIYDPSAPIAAGAWHKASYLAANAAWPSLDRFVADVLSKRGLTDDAERPSHFWNAWKSVAKNKGGLSDSRAADEGRRAKQAILDGIRFVVREQQKSDKSA